LANQVLIEFSQFLGGYPILLETLATRILNLVSRQKFPAYRKTGDIPRTGGWNIPVASNLDGVFFAQHWVEDRLIRQPRRERPKTGCFD